MSVIFGGDFPTCKNIMNNTYSIPSTHYKYGSKIILILDIDECASGPCMNGGFCADGVNRYRCNCLPGWSGDRCQTSKLTF